MASSESVGTIFAPICWYSLAFLMGRNFNDAKLTKKCVFVTTGILCGAMLIRFIAKYRLDGAILYDRYIVGYTSAVTAFCIFILFTCFFHKRRPNAVVQFISDISYEIYLYHNIFTIGMLSLFGRTPCWATDCVLVTAITIIVAFVMNKVGKWITRKLSIKEKAEREDSH